MKKRLTTSLVIFFCVLASLSLLSGSVLALESTGNVKLDQFINDPGHTHGISWGYYQRPKLANYDSIGCAAYCADYVKYCYGIDNPRSGAAFYNRNEIRAGDVITVPGHWFVVLNRSGDRLYVAEGNCDNKVRIGWNYTVGSVSLSIGYHYNLIPNPEPTPTPTPTPDPIPQGKPIGGGSRILSDGEYHIVSAVDGSKGLDAAGAENKNGTNCWLWNTIDDPNQVFTIKWLGDGFYSIIHKKTGKSLDVSNASLDYGANVQLWDQNGSDAQKWVLKETDDPCYFEILSKCNGLCVDVNGAGTSNGTNIQMYGENGTSAQKWKLIAWGDSTGQTLSDGKYEIVSAVDNVRRLGVMDAGKENGTKIEVRDRTNTANQKWNVKYLGKGYYEIADSNSGKLLDLAKNSQRSGEVIQIYEKNGSDAQKWILKDAGDGYFNIICKGSGLYVSWNHPLFLFNTIGGVVGNNDAFQKWKFVPESQAANKFKVSLVANPTEGGMVSGEGECEEGASIRVTAKANDGYKFDGWYESNKRFSTERALDYSPSYDTTLTARFIKISEPDFYSVLISTSPSGGGSVSGSGSYKDGALVTLNASPSEGYTFDGWYKGEEKVSSDLTYTFEAESDVTLQAHFKKEIVESSTYKVTVSASPSEGGSVSGDGTFNRGNSVTVTASPNSGYTFDGWYNGSIKVTDESTYNFYISADTTLVAKFTESTISTPSTQVEIYRLYNPSTGEHLYTISQDEVKALTSAGWNYESVGWVAPSSGQAVYRLFNSAINDHLYTMDENEVNELTTKQGWTADFSGEPIFYSGGGTPVYRLYNDNSKRHHLTTDEFEYQMLAEQGWKQEGAALQALSK